ncbi:MAG: tRNA (adenosine(37)-N6)-threonylcarbamoyltransferase complex dimerization subunit type 1 TsaB [Sphingorhabdus sp.]
MRRLIIDTATRACSVALFEGDECLAAIHEDIGRGHAERLVPMIAELPDKGRADSIYVDVGPGSFTGIRVGVSAARALALAWGAECHGYCSLDLVAAMARNGAAIDVDVAVTGGHGEYYFQSFGSDGVAIGDARSLSPADAAKTSMAERVAGDMAERLITTRGSGEAIDLLPNAQFWPAICAITSLPPSPFYVRGPDAKLPGGNTP